MQRRHRDVPVADRLIVRPIMRLPLVLPFFDPVIGAPLRIVPHGDRFSWTRYLYRAWRRGRDAAPLTLARYEELLARPLEEVRRMLRITPASVAHPDGIVVAYRNTRPPEPIVATS